MQLTAMGRTLIQSYLSPTVIPVITILGRRPLYQRPLTETPCWVPRPGNQWLRPNARNALEAHTLADRMVQPHQLWEVFDYVRPHSTRGRQYYPSFETGVSPIIRSRTTAGPALCENFLYVFKPGRHGPDAPPLAPASARSRSAPRARRAAGARHEGPVVDAAMVASERGRRAIVRSRPPSVKPATRPDPSRPSAH